MSLPTANEFKEAAENAVEEMRTWAEVQFYLNLPINLQIIDRRTRFLGQASSRYDRQERFKGYFLKVCSFDFLRYQHIAVCEYRSFNDSKTIGAFETTDWKLGLRALIAHEMAHIIQFALRRAAYQYSASSEEHPLFSHWEKSTPVFRDLGVYEGNHGHFFQAVYQQVREQFINGHVPPEAYQSQRVAFAIPDDFEDRLAAMPKTGLEGIRFENNGRILEVVGRNPNRNRLFGFHVRDADGVFRRIKMGLIYVRSEEARQIINHDPALFAEFKSHCIAMHTKKLANLKSSRTKQRRSKTKA